MPCDSRSSQRRQIVALHADRQADVDGVGGPCLPGLRQTGGLDGLKRKVSIDRAERDAAHLHVCTEWTVCQEESVRCSTPAR